MAAALMIDMEAALVHAMINPVIGSFIAAIALWAAVKLVQKVSVPYWSAYMAVLLAAIVNGFMILTFSVALGEAGKAVIVLSTPVIVIGIFSLLLAQFLIQAAFVNLRLKIPFGRACLVTLVMVGIILAIAAILFAPLFFMSRAFSN